MWPDTADHIGKKPRNWLFTEIGVAPCPGDTAHLRSQWDWVMPYDNIPEREGSPPHRQMMAGGRWLRECAWVSGYCWNIYSYIWDRERHQRVHILEYRREKPERTTPPYRRSTLMLTNFAVQLLGRECCSHRLSCVADRGQINVIYYHYKNWWEATGQAATLY